MPTPMIKELIRQLFSNPATNRFPAKYIPKSVTEFIEQVGKGNAEINPPVPVPEGFRGKITYEREKCIGCLMCIKVCPSGAIEFIPGRKKVRIYISRCTFCSQCNDVCPVNCLHMSDEFLLADYDKVSRNLVVE